MSGITGQTKGNGRGYTEEDEQSTREHCDGISLNGESVQLPGDANYIDKDDLSSIHSSDYENTIIGADESRRVQKVQVTGSLLGPMARDEESLQRRGNEANYSSAAQYYDNDDSSLGISSLPRGPASYGNAANYYDNDDSSLGICSINTSTYHDRGATTRKQSTGDESFVPVGATIDSDDESTQADSAVTSGCRPWRKAMIVLVLAVLVGIVVLIAQKTGSTHSNNNGATSASDGMVSTAPPVTSFRTLAPANAPATQSEKKSSKSKSKGD